MTTPFREGAVPCPHCNVSLRELGVAGRLVCDHCGGMMLEMADFERSLLESSADPAKLVMGSRTTRACPRCSGPLTSAEIVAGGTALDATVQWCANHGVWLDGGTLEPLLEQLGKPHGWRGALGVRGYAGAGGGAIAGLAGPGQFVRWWERNPRPRVHTPFASAFTAGSLACPICAAPLELHAQLWGCHAPSHGVFVENDALQGMVSEMIGGPYQLPPVHGTTGSRSCPACKKALVVEDLETITIDRCSDHGIWFDPNELEATLSHAADAHQRGIRHWLRHLFE